jgi:hypothetical protein
LIHPFLAPPANRSTRKRSRAATAQSLPKIARKVRKVQLPYVKKLFFRSRSRQQGDCPQIALSARRNRNCTHVRFPPKEQADTSITL